MNAVVRIPVSHQSGKGRSGYGLDRLFLRHHASAGEPHGVDSRFNHLVHILDRTDEPVAGPEASLLRLVVVHAQPSELVRMKRVICRTEDATEHAHRVFECPRAAGRQANHPALLSDQRGFGLEMRVFGALGIEPAGTGNCHVRAWRESDDDYDVLRADNLR